MIKQFLGIINSEFKDYNRRKFLQDLMAGITVAAVALPLALAFGVSSGTTAAAGLITAIVAGIIISSLSGAFYQISGPTGAMAAILISLIGKYGMNGIFIATFMAGIFLLLAGIFRLGNLISLIPSPVITGFTSGIAIIIASGQIKNFFGIEHFTGSFFDLMKFISGLHIDYPSTIIGLLTILLMIFYPKSWGKKFPASLLAILLSTLAVLALKLDIPLVGKIPTTLIPQAHLRLTELNLQDMKTLLIPAISITVLGMTESLLCGASAGRATNHPMDNNQELVAQGIGNIFIPFFRRNSSNSRNCSNKCSYKIRCSNSLNWYYSRPYSSSINVSICTIYDSYSTKCPCWCSYHDRRKNERVGSHSFLIQK